MSKKLYGKLNKNRDVPLKFNSLVYHTMLKEMMIKFDLIDTIGNSFITKKILDIVNRK